MTIEAVLHLAWGTTHKHCRMFTDCEFVKLLGIELWLRKWELNGWRTGGEGVSHADVWKRILAWVKKFETGFWSLCM